jgi:hypothetical protein
MSATSELAVFPPFTQSREFWVLMGYAVALGGSHCCRITLYRSQAPPSAHGSAYPAPTLPEAPMSQIRYGARLGPARSEQAQFLRAAHRVTSSVGAEFAVDHPLMGLHGVD